MSGPVGIIVDTNYQGIADARYRCSIRELVLPEKIKEILGKRPQAVQIESLPGKNTW